MKINWVILVSCKSPYRSIGHYKDSEIKVTFPRSNGDKKVTSILERFVENFGVATCIYSDR